MTTSERHRRRRQSTAARERTRKRATREGAQQSRERQNGSREEAQCTELECDKNVAAWRRVRRSSSSSSRTSRECRSECGSVGVGEDGLRLCLVLRCRTSHIRTSALCTIDSTSYSAQRDESRIDRIPRLLLLLLSLRWCHRYSHKVASTDLGRSGSLPAVTTLRPAACTGSDTLCLI